MTVDTFVSEKMTFDDRRGAVCALGETRVPLQLHAKDARGMVYCSSDAL